MCQLTLLDIDPKTKLGKSTIRNLIELNSTAIVKESPQSNTDGFGYMTFAKAPEIIKTVLSAKEWWQENWEKYQKSVRNPNGIYHVRAASYNSIKLHEDDSHPFYHGHIILAHNGTMQEDKSLENDEEMQKLFMREDKREMIDSEKFCVVLSNTCDNQKLTKEHIQTAMESFHGPFAMLIYDTKQPEKIFVIRGKDRSLYKAELYADKEHKEPLGLVLNTQFFQLSFWAKQVKALAKEFYNMNLEIGISTLEEEKIYDYKIGSYELDKPVGDIEQTIKTIITTPHPWPDRAITSPKTDDDVYRSLYKNCEKINMSLSELMILAEVCLNKSLHTSSMDDLEYLNLVLEELTTYDYKGREKVWNEFIKDNKINPLMAYKCSDIPFPFMLASKKIIKARAKKAVIPPVQ